MLRKLVLLAAGIGLLGAGPAAADAPAREPVAAPAVTGPLPGTAPGDPASPDVADTYPFFSTPDDLRSRGYVEQEFLLSGLADGYDTAGLRVATDVPYATRVVVRRPADPRRFNGTALVEWQNVTAGYDLDALWNTDTVTRARIRVGRCLGAARRRRPAQGLEPGAVRRPRRHRRRRLPDRPALVRRLRPGRQGGRDPRPRRRPRRPARADRPRPRRLAVRGPPDGLLRPGAAAGGAGLRRLLLHRGPRAGAGGREPVFQVLSETDVRSPARPRGHRASSGAGRSPAGRTPGYEGQVYRAPIPSATSARRPSTPATGRRSAGCRSATSPRASYAHLRRWVRARHAAAHRAAAGVRGGRRHQGARRARPRPGRHPAVAGGRARGR